MQSLGLAKLRFEKLKTKLRDYRASLMGNRGGLLMEVGKKVLALEELQGFSDTYIMDYLGIADPEAIDGFRQSFSKVIMRYSYHLLSAFRKSSLDIDREQTFKLSYFEICGFFKFMNVSSFKFDSNRLEPFLNSYVRDSLRDPFFTQYFGVQSTVPTPAQKRPSILRRQNTILIGSALPTGENVYDAYLKYYRHEFGARDLVQLMIAVVFGVFSREIQDESRALKSISLSKEECASPARVSNVCTFMERFLQTVGLSCSKLGSKHPFR